MKLWEDNMNGKIAFVTGGTSGIGKEIVLELLERGCKVITCYSTNSENANILMKEAESENLSIYQCDVSKEKDVMFVIQKIKEKYGSLDYVVNNAGTFIDSYIKDFSIEDFKKVLDINLIGKVIVSKHAYSIMNEGGSIVNISSHLGVKPCTESAAYCSAAAAIINFTKASALEFADKKFESMRFVQH